MGSLYTVQNLRPHSVHTPSASAAVIAADVGEAVLLGILWGLAWRFIPAYAGRSATSWAWLENKNRLLRRLIGAAMIGAVFAAVLAITLAIGPRPSWYVHDAAIVLLVGYASTLMLLMTPIHGLIRRPEATDRNARHT